MFTELARVFSLKNFFKAIMLILLPAGVLFAPTTAGAAVGRTPGSFAVSPTGAATYTIPIWAPTGPGGVQPNLSLSYNSDSGNGPIGVGWSLAGLSVITRCSGTVAQDSAATAVTLTATDRFCLDGNRLRLTSSESLSTYGQPGTTYQTEIANFENVTAKGTTGTGPSYFTMQTPSGWTYQYGNTTSSQILGNGSATVSAWYLNQVSDTFGNTMTITYETANQNSDLEGTTVPQSISWTLSGAGSSTYNYTMTFGYETLASPTKAGYVAGTPVQNYYLLANILESYAGTTIKNYVLGYTASTTTGRETLTSLSECADSAASNCLGATQISYQSGQQGVATTADTLTGVQTEAGDLVTAAFDLNGDGINDLAVYHGGTWEVSFGSPTGYSAPVNTGIASSIVQLGSVDASGTAGFLTPVSGVWYYYKWNGSEFAGVSTGAAVPAGAAEATTALGDVDGDGRPDIVYINTSTNYIEVQLNTTTNGTPSFGSPIQTVSLNGINSITASIGGYRSSLDFYGDGQSDIVAYAPYVVHGLTHTYVYALHFSAGTFSESLLANLSANTTLIDIGDYNDDGCVDFLTSVTLYLSSCNGVAATELPISAGTAVAGMDWDHSGRRAVVVDNGGTIGIYKSAGNALGSLITTTIPYSSNNIYQALPNATGDGMDALGVFNQTASPATFQYYLQNGAGQPPDLLSEVTDGYGNSVSPTYVSLAQTVNSYFFPRTDAASSYQNYIGPLYVVNQASFSDPSSATGGTYQQTNFYSGAWMNLQGRGFAGFEAHQVQDSRNNVYETFDYNLAFPYTGMLLLDYTTEDNLSSEYLGEVVNTLSCTILSESATCTPPNGPTSQRYFTYASNSTTFSMEPSAVGSWAQRLVMTASTNYTYDDYGNALTVATTVTDNNSDSPYYNGTWTTTTTNTPDVNIATWCLGLLTQTQVTYTSSVDNAVTRTKQFTPNTTNCRYTQIVTEPSSATYKVTESIGYDEFGNISSDSVTGVGMGAASPATRTTAVTWYNSTYPTGQFPLSVQDPSGTTSQLTYNYSFGKVSGRTDANGAATAWIYDGFGRQAQETRPDGTYTQWTYNNCVNWGGCLIGSNTLSLAHTIYNTDGSTLSGGTTFFDPLQRPVIYNGVLPVSGTYYRLERRYDSLGRVVEQAAPCAFTSVPSSCPYMTTIGYDVINRVTSVSRPISASNNMPETTNYTYQGGIAKVTDPQLNATTTVKDVNGWLRQTTDPGGYSVTTAYDAAGSRVGVTDNARNSLWSGAYAYGVSPFLVNSTDMDLGAWSYTVDALGERTGWTDAKGQSFGETYDALSRPLTRTEPDQFTQWTWGASAASYNLGKLQSVCMGPAPASGSAGACTSLYYSESETYDSVGRRSQRTITIPSTGTFTYTWAYNATTGLLSSLTYPTSTSGAALQLQYAYRNGLPLSVTAVIPGSSNVTVWQANATDAAGHVTQETLGNGIVTNRAFDADTAWLSSIQSGVGGGASVQNQSFLYDYVGNVTQRQDNNLGLTENLYYDNDYRLTSSKLGTTQNLAINYDVTGNITSRSDVANAATWTYDPVRKHAVTQAGSSAYVYSYDANGNAITRQGSSILWTSYNYPTAISAGSGSTAEDVTFSYGPDRQRWQQTYSGNGIAETTDYVGRALEIVSSGGITDYRHYISANGRAVAVYSRKSNGTNTFSYVLSDHENSVASITNSSGASVVNESFTPFGSRRNPTSWSGAPSTGDLTTAAGITREGYTFQTQLGLWMGLNHMNGRVQDSLTGRFLSADPIVQDAANAQAYNRYTYVYNNPLTNTDPTGFDSCNDPMTPCDTSITGSPDLVDTPAGDGSCQASGCTCDARGFCTVTGCGNCDTQVGIQPYSYVPQGIQGQNQGGRARKPQGDNLPCKNASSMQGVPATPAPLGGSEADTVAVAGGTAFADATLATLGETTEGLKIPNVNLGAIRVVGGITSATGIVVSAYSGYQNLSEGNYSSAAVNGADIGVTSVGLAFPPALPFSIGYGLGRTLSDIAQTLSKVGEPDILEQVAYQVGKDVLSQAIMSGVTGCP
jgi:RHS repeat-associated protein